jgi:type IV pilus assembly protein PilY1
VAIVTGGYHPSGDPNDFANYAPDATAGRAIYMIDVVTGKVLAEKKFDSSLSPSEPEYQMRYAIASRPAVFDLDFDGYADVIYVGDLGGNLWKWVVRPVGGDPVNGVGAGDLASQPNWTFKKFFAAPSHYDSVSGDTFYKSLFFPPTGTIHHGQLLLGFATGERANLEADWLAGEDGDNNRIYVMSDLDPFEKRATPFTTLTEGDLENLTDSSNCVDAATYRGYYVVGRDGEKFVTNSSIFLGDFFTGSFIPTGSADPCAARGEAYLYRLVLSCGEGAFDPAVAGSTQPADLRRVKIGTGLPAPPRFSVGPPPDPPPPGPPPPPPPCQNRVLVLTSDGDVNNQCAGIIDDTGVNLHTWQQRD